MMNSSPDPFPPALSNGQIEKIFEDVYFVKGKIEMKMGFLKMSFSRSMTILRQGKDLVLVNTIRLDEEGLDELDKLGKVKHVIRVAGFHGRDDPFYKNRYGAKVWALEGTSYFYGFDSRGETYFDPDKWMSKATKLPIKGASLVVIETSNPAEGVLIVDRPEGTILVTGDAFQNFETTDEHFNCLGRIMMRLMGFIKPCNIGPAWYSATKPDCAELAKILEHKFDHVLPCHGNPVIGKASEKYEQAVKSLKRFAKYSS